MFVKKNFSNISPGAGNGLRIWCYHHDDDVLAAVKTDDYFNEMRFSLRHKDLIIVSAKDKGDILGVTSMHNAKRVTTKGLFED